MNWKMTGVTLVCAGVVGGAAAAAMTFAFEPSVSQKAHWAIECFNGSTTACLDSRSKEDEVAEWRTRAWVVGGVSVVGLVVGGALLAGAARRE